MMSKQKPHKHWVLRLLPHLTALSVTGGGVRSTPNKEKSMVFLSIRHRTRFDIMSSGKEHMDFRTQYFEIWQQAWSLHKKYFGIQQWDEQRWKQLNDECETLDARFKGQSEQKFMQSLLLAVS